MTLNVKIFLLEIFVIMMTIINSKADVSIPPAVKYSIIIFIRLYLYYALNLYTYVYKKHTDYIKKENFVLNLIIHIRKKKVTVEPVLFHGLGSCVFWYFLCS